MESEKTKMIMGKPYKASDAQLVQERDMAKELLFTYNTLAPKEVDHRNEILKKLLGGLGVKFHIEAPFRCDYGYNIELGENFYSNYNLLILDCANVRIGDNALIGPNVSIYTAGHPLHYELRNLEVEYAFPVSVGNNVWIGGNVVINPGVSIGDNSDIGSGSVVTKDIPDNVIAMGNPCKVLRKITNEDKLYYYKKLTFDCNT